MNHGFAVALSVRTEENGRSEDPLKGTDQTAVVRSALLHSESAEHSGGTIEANPRRPLADRKRRDEDRHEAVLSPRETIARVSRHLLDELTVPALVKRQP
jgi:hypothetical protein